MKKYILLVLLIVAVSSLFSQTKFEDAVALNFKNANVAVAGFFDNAGNLNIAKISTKDGSYFVEYGAYDANGAYSVKRTFEMNSYTTDFKIRFSADGTKLAVLELSTDKNLLSFFDLQSGQIIQDFDAENINNFFLTPDSKYIVASGPANSILFDIYDDNILLNYPGESVVDISEDGNTLFCKNGGNIDYVDTKSGKKLRSFMLKDFISIDFDERGELILCSFQGNIKLFKLTQNGIIGIKEISNVSLRAVPTPTFNYFLVDDPNASRRWLFNLGGKQVYKSKIDNYNQAKGNYVFSNDEKKFALLSDKGTEVYDFEVMKYYNKIAQKFPDMFQTKVDFQTEQDQVNRADMFKLQKQVIVSNVADELKVSEGIIKQNQKNSLGLIEVKIFSIGVYDPNTEMYDVTLTLPTDYTIFENVNARVKIPKYQAEIFSKNFQKFKAYALRQLNKEQTGIDVFDVTIVNDLNSTNYRCIMHRSLPVTKTNYDEQFNQGQKTFEQRDWYDAIMYLSDFPDDYAKNSVIDYMLGQAIPNFFADKWSYVQTLNPVRDSTTLLKYISDFPPTFKVYSDVAKLRQTVVNSIMDSRMDNANAYYLDKRYSDALDYIDASIPSSYYDVFSNASYDYEYYNSKLVPFRNNVLVIVAKRSIEGTNYDRAINLLERVTKDYPDYAEVEKLLSDAKFQKGK
ncbi:MAG: hypothetical protein WCK13_12175 [Ignavibacteriota bacterium]|nr:hypothetical protein [Ignavibacteriota bacterium]